LKKEIQRSIIELVIVGGKKFLISDSHKIVDIRLPDVNNSVKLGDQLGATELWLDKTMMKLCWPGNYQRALLTIIRLIAQTMNSYKKYEFIRTH
jgi:hypothetical protein